MKEAKYIPQSQLIAQFNKILATINKIAPELKTEYGLPEKVDEKGICFGLTMIAAFAKSLPKQKQSDQFDLLYWIAGLDYAEIESLIKHCKEESKDTHKFSFYEVITILKKINFENYLDDFNENYKSYSKGIAYEFVNQRKEQGNWKDLKNLVSKTLKPDGFWRIMLDFGGDKIHSIAIFIKNGEFHLYDCNMDISAWFGPLSLDKTVNSLMKLYNQEKISIIADLIRPHRGNSDFYRQVNILFQWQKMQLVSDKSAISFHIQQYDQDLISQVQFARYVIYSKETLPEKSRDYFAKYIYNNLSFEDFSVELEKSIAHPGLTERLLKEVSASDLKKLKPEMAIAAAKSNLVKVLSFFPIETLTEVQKSIQSDQKQMAALTRVVLHKIDPRFPLIAPSFLALRSNIPTQKEIIAKLPVEQMQAYAAFFPEKPPPLITTNSY